MIRWLMTPVLLGMVAAALVIVFSKQGFTDWMSFKARMQKTEQRVQLLERQNAALKRQVDLLARPSAELAERNARLQLGWVRSDEIIYRER